MVSEGGLNVFVAFGSPNPKFLARRSIVGEVCHARARCRFIDRHEWFATSIGEEAAAGCMIRYTAEVNAIGSGWPRNQVTVFVYAHDECRKNREHVLVVVLDGCIRPPLVAMTYDGAIGQRDALFQDS